MCLAAGVERGRAFRALVYSQIGLDRQLRLARTAEDSWLVPLGARPLLCGVLCTFGMAEMARIVPSTAVEADGNDVELGRIVLAPGVVIDRSAQYLWRCRHRLCLCCSRGDSGHAVEAKLPSRAYNMEFQQLFLPWSAIANSCGRCDRSTQRRRKDPAEVTLSRPTLIVLLSLFAISILTILGIAAVTFATDGGGFSGSGWLVGLGFGALWMAFACPVLVALLAAVAWVRRRSTPNAK